MTADLASLNALDSAVFDLCRSVSEKVILPRHRNLAEGEIDDKGGGDPVTIADRESEILLHEGLMQIDASLGFVGEETTHADPSAVGALSSPCWIVDPLDGTRNFAKGVAPFGILIAQADNGLCHSAWIYDCLSGRFCTAHAGHGAKVGGEKIVSRPTGETPPVAALSLLFMNPAKRQAVLDHIAPHYRMVDVPYCAAEQYPRLGLGTNDVSIFERTLAWDHAAGVLWLNEAGGKAARLDGSAYRVDETGRQGLIGAATPQLWDSLAEQMAKITA